MAIQREEEFGYCVQKPMGKAVRGFPCVVLILICMFAHHLSSVRLGRAFRIPNINMEGTVEHCLQLEFLMNKQFRYPNKRLSYSHVTNSFMYQVRLPTPFFPFRFFNYKKHQAICDLKEYAKLLSSKTFIILGGFPVMTGQSLSRKVRKG